MLFFVFLARIIPVVLTVSTCVVSNSSIVATCPPIPAARFAFSLCFICFDFLVRSCCICEPKRKQGRGLIDHNIVQTPSNFTAGRPKADLLLWFFGDFRCGELLFMVILVTFKYKNT